MQKVGEVRRQEHKRPTMGIKLDMRLLDLSVSIRAGGRPSWREAKVYKVA